MVWVLEQLEVPAGNTQQTTQATDANAPVIQRYWISSASSPITIGRPLKKGGASCDIVVGDDTSVSKVHVKLELRPASTQGPGLFVTDTSRFGTHLSGRKLATNEATACGDGDILKLGPKTVFKLRSHPVTVVLPSSAALPADQQQQAGSIGLRIAVSSSQWSPSVTYVVQEDGQLATTCLLAALLADQPLITSGWVTGVLAPKVHVGALPDVAQHKPREALIQAGSGAPVGLSLPEHWAHSRSLLQGLKVAVDKALEGDAALAWSLQRLGAVLVAPKAGATLLVTGSRSAAAQGAASVLAVDDLLAALLTGNTSLLPQPAASQLAAANTSVVGQGAAQGTAATAMEEDDDDDVTEAGEGEEDEGEEVEQGRQAHVHGSSATVQQAKTLRGRRGAAGVPQPSATGPSEATPSVRQGRTRQAGSSRKQPQGKAGPDHTVADTEGADEGQGGAAGAATPLVYGAADPSDAEDPTKSNVKESAAKRARAAVSLDAVFGAVPTLQPLRLTQQPLPSQAPPAAAAHSTAPAAAAGASTQQQGAAAPAKGRGKGKAKALAAAGSTDLGPVGGAGSGGASTLTGAATAATDGQAPEPIVVLMPLIVRPEPPVQPDTPEGTSPAPATTPGGSKKGRGLLRSKADKAAAVAAAAGGQGGGQAPDSTAGHQNQQGPPNFKRFVKASVLVNGRQVPAQHMPHVPVIPLQRADYFKKTDTSEMFVREAQEQAARRRKAEELFADGAGAKGRKRARG